MKYIKTIMDSLSAITTSEAGQACLRLSKAKTDEDRQKMLLRFSADFSDLDDLLGKADEALRVLNENRPQFNIDHCDKQTQPEFIRLLNECAVVSDTLYNILNRTETDTPQSWTGDNHIIRRVAAWNMYGSKFRDLMKVYASPFDEFILVEDKEGVKAKLHQLLDGQKGIKLAFRVVAAQEVGLIDKQVGFADLKSEFHVEGSKQAYSSAIIKIGENAERRQPHYKYEIEQLKANLMA